MHLNYTSREGGPELRRIANERAQRHLPGGGIRFFDVRHDFPDIFAMFIAGERKKQDRKHVDLPLRFRRKMFPFLTGHRTVKVTRIEISIETLEHVDVGRHIDIHFLPNETEPHEKQNINCVVSSSMPRVYHGSLQVDLGPITGDIIPHEFGRLRVPHSLRKSPYSKGGGHPSVVPPRLPQGSSLMTACINALLKRITCKSHRG